MAFLPIPEFPRYCISEKGVVLDTVNEEILQVLQGSDELTLYTKVRLLYPNRTDRYKLESVAKLMLLTHKCIPDLHQDTVWAPKVLREDGSINHVRDLDYDFGEYTPPVPKDNNEFHPVPGYIETHINLNGMVLLSGTLSKIGDQKGYAVASARLPSGKSVTVGRHRLMALTFLKHPRFCEDLLVNHINGKPSEDALGNLEWVTSRGNIIHAHKSKLVSNHHPVEAIHLESGKIVEYFSIGAFIRHYNLNVREAKRLDFRIRTFGVINNYRGISLRLKSSQVAWDKIAQADRYQGNIKEVLVRDLETGETKEFSLFLEACNFLDVSQYRLRTGLQKFGEVKIGQRTATYAKQPILPCN